MELDYGSFFQTAFSSEDKYYPYQEHLATEAWPDILSIPTGLGKTAAIVLAWAYKRLRHDQGTPRRLVYCLPMRVLVEQTFANARQWIDNLTEANVIPYERKPSVHVLMGGDLDNDWDRYPENDSILIGTQDQLLSRALNRGYGSSRFRWPMQFGLLNNDCLWVLDEVQLMGSGLATTAQLQAFRDSLGTARPVHSIWMSATLQTQWLNTIDFAPIAQSLTKNSLTNEDQSNPSIRRLIDASKAVSMVDPPSDNMKQLAQFILDAHRKGTRTLVVLNTVKRAMMTYKEIVERKPATPVSLVHSRFRPGDRAKAIEKLLAPVGKEGSICIATQVVEAGVDISSSTLITDLAPWASLVQRFGRCNRYGNESGAQILWLDMNAGKKGSALPYDEAEIEHSKSILKKVKDAAIRTLPPVDSPTEYTHVVRKKDIVDLFDTTPDLAGSDIDISRFIREEQDHDVQVFWRGMPDGEPSGSLPGPSREELCGVPVGEIKGLKGVAKWHWDHLEKKWRRPDSIVPGIILLLRQSEGCYDALLGWTGMKADIPELIAAEEKEQEGDDDDILSAGTWQSLSIHNEMVVNELDQLLSNFNLPSEITSCLREAARWHDAGKAHEVFQHAVAEGSPESEGPPVVWAKSGRNGIKYARRGFRHELASALAVMESGAPDLVTYLVAAHHGKVRLSIRSLPHETRPEDPSIRFARGIWDADILQCADLGGGKELKETRLDLSCMELGDGERGPSWLRRMLSLRDDPLLGPFRLAFYEALLRAADWRGSAKTGGN